MRVAVVGGGLAGITVALRLADAGHDVVLHEARPRLGGLTHSFRRDGPAGPLWVDNGQHVFLRCCTAYRALLDRLGSSAGTSLQPRLDVVVRSERRAGTGRLRRVALPAPLHLAPTLARYRWLSRADRARIVPAALALARVDRDDPATDEVSFGDWLTRHGQSPEAVAAVWDLIGVATLNAPAERASLALAATVFQLGLLDRADGADIGWADVPLQRLHGDAAQRALAASGVRVRLGSRVADLDALAADSPDHVVLAAPPAETERLAGDAVLAPAGWAEALGSSPIVNLHLVVDRPVLEHRFVAAVDGPLQWVFDRTAASGLPRGQCLAVSLSAADDLVDLTVAQLRVLLWPHLVRLLPGLARAEVVDLFVTRERRATFRPTPGSARYRPGTRTRRPDLHLAGAWTATGWPATMEGAVRSGEAAARSVLTGRTRRRAAA
jgi:squalene-associated FAD-dependent desaturase